MQEIKGVSEAQERVSLVSKYLIIMGLLIVLLGVLPVTQAQASGAMVIDSFDGPVTQNEINSFKSYIQTIEPVVWPNTGSMQGEYAQGKSGENIKAMGLMYEMTGDTAILDRMIYFCDVLLSQRNDLLPAPYGQRTVWTNTIAPVWPGNNTGVATADTANGDPVGHLAYCGKLILQTPAIWDTSVSIGDSYSHGTTYRERAATFIQESDYVVNQFLLPSLLDLSRGNKYFFSAQSPYMTGAIMPWNQQMMISYGLQNLAAAHEIIGDNPSLVAQYDGIVQTNLNWFFSDDSAKQTYTDKVGNTAYNWGYNPTLLGGEDSNHASLDVAGYYRAFLSGRYGITAVMMKPFANMYVDMMMRGPNDFAGRVDGTDGTGHGAPTAYARSGNLFLADLRPDAYYDLANADLQNKTTTSLDTFARFIWAKNERFKEGYSLKFSPSPGSFTGAQIVNLTSLTSGASIRYTTDGSIPTATTGTLYTAPFTVSSTTTVKAVAFTSVSSSPVSIGKYTIASNDLQAPTAPTNLIATTASSSQINLNWTASTDNVGVVSYDIYRGAVIVGSSTTTSYSDPGLSASTVYSYTVRAKDAANNTSAASNAASATTMATSGIIASSMSYLTHSGDATINMNLQGGDSIVSIQDSSGNLTAGVDYVNNGTSVTLKSGYLAMLPIGQTSYVFTFASGNTAVMILTISQENIALNKSYFTSSKWSDTYPANAAFDGNVVSRWSSGKGLVQNQYVGVDFGSEQEFNKVVLKETSFPRVNSYVLQYSDDGTTYFDIPGTASTSIGAEKIISFDSIQARYVRLWIYSTVSKEPSINEIEIYKDIIDEIDPETTALSTPASPDGLNGWYRHPVTVQLSASDNLSGVARTEYQVNNGAWTTYEGAIPTLGDGGYTIHYRSVDQAGNVEPYKTLSFNIDTTAPILNVQLNKSIIWPANHKMITVQAVVYATDEASGVASVRLTSITSNEPITQGDIIANFQTEATSFQVRAERLGNGNGRTYTVTYTATDVAGNSSDKSVVLTVPHDQYGKEK